MKHWFLAGTTPKDYLIGVDDAVTYNGMKAAYLRSNVDEPAPFGTLMQTFKAKRYRNKRVRFTAVVKSEGVSSWAGLWMRIDDPKGEILQFDNMRERPIKGSGDWQRYKVVLDVPEESDGIFFGILLDGKGKLWLSDVQFAEAPDEATTDIERDEPGNLDFSED